MPKIVTQKKVLLLLSEGFEMIEASGFTDVFAWASFQEDVSISVTSAAIHPAVKAAFGGLSITSLQLLNDVELHDYDALAIPGGMEWAGFFEDAYSTTFKNTIKHFVDQKKPIAAVCVASLSLAHAGGLTGRKAAIYHSAKGKHKVSLEDHGAVFVDRPIVKDGNITTSSGPGTSLEVALSLLADLVDAQAVSTTRIMMRAPLPSAQWYEPQVPVISG